MAAHRYPLVRRHGCLGLVHRPLPEPRRHEAGGVGAFLHRHQTSLVWASLFEVVFAGERMTWLIAAGTLAIMMGSILLVYEKGEIQRRIPLYYYVVPLGTAILFAMTHLFGKFGLQVIKSASLGMTVGSMIAFFSMLLILPFSVEGRKPTSWDKKGLLAVLCGACLNAMAAFSSGRPLKQGTSFSLFRSTASRCCSSFSCPGCFLENKRRWASVSSSAVSCPSWEPLGLFWANRFQEKVARPGGAIQFCSSRVPNADKVRAQNRFLVFVCMRGTLCWKSVSSSR